MTVAIALHWGCILASVMVRRSLYPPQNQIQHLVRGGDVDECKELTL